MSHKLPKLDKLLKLTGQLKTSHKTIKLIKISCFYRLNFFKLFTKLFLGALFFCFSFNSLSIYDLKTNTGGLPKHVEAKHWILVSQACQPCAELLEALKSFCAGKKPAPARLGFFATGPNPKELLKKLKDFKTDYEIFSGSANEFYQTYQILGAPSLKIKAKNKNITGKNQILKFLKTDSQFCSV